MTNIRIGDRVVDKTSGRHGVVDSFIRPISFGFKPIVKARVKMDDGSVRDVEPHNLSVEEGYKAPTYDPVGVNDRKDPNDSAESLSPIKPKRKKKKQDENSALMGDIEASIV